MAINMKETKVDEIDNKLKLYVNTSMLLLLNKI